METKTKADLKSGQQGGKVSFDVAAEHKETVAGVGVTFSVGASSTDSIEQKADGDNVSWKATSEVVTTVKAGLDVKQAQVKTEHAEGVKVSYNVVVPKDAAQRLDPTTVSPYDPATMPVGSKVSLDGSVIQKTKVSGAFNHVALESRQSVEEGSVVAIEKKSDHVVRVVTGPKEAVANYGGFGVVFDDASVMLGREDKLDYNQQLKTAEFDLSTPEGQAAYNQFLGLGGLPDQPGPGVPDVAVVERLSYSSATQLGLKVSKLEENAELQKNTGDVEVTRRPDGTLRSMTQKIHYDSGVPLSIQSKFDDKGQELLSERRYVFTFDANEQNIPYLQCLPIPGANELDIKPGQKLSLVLTEEQMQQLQRDVRQAAPWPADAQPWIQSGQPQDDPSKVFALRIAATHGDQYRVVDAMYNLYLSKALSGAQLPGTLQVEGKAPALVPDKPAASQATSGFQAAQTASLADAAHPGHGLFNQIRDHVHAMDAQYGRVPNEQSSNLAGMLTVAAVAQGITRAEGVAPNANDASTMYVYGSPGRTYAEVPTVQALNTPLPVSSAAYHQAAQQAQVSQAAQAQQAQQENLQAQVASR